MSFVNKEEMDVTQPSDYNDITHLSQELLVSAVGAPLCSCGGSCGDTHYM